LVEGEKVNRYPKAKQLPITPGSSDPTIRPVMVVLHVDAGNSSSLWGWFNGPSGGIESHLFIKRSGEIEQYRAFDREADAQLGGNSWVGSVDGTATRLGAISVETQGWGPGWWTQAQKDAIKELLLWCRKELDIPLRVVQTPNPRTPGGGGVGYHSLFDAWNSLGKSCPGPRRIAWFDKTLRPWLTEHSKAFVFAQPNDTWAKIADARGLTERELVRLNQPEDGARVRVR
jgi:hypothetical protein